MSNNEKEVLLGEAAAEASELAINTLYASLEPCSTKDMVETLVYTSGNVFAEALRSVFSARELDGMSDAKKYSYVASNVMNVKALVQEVIGDVFSQIMSIEMNKQLDYYCEVSLVPEAVNKEPC